MFSNIKSREVNVEKSWRILQLFEKHGSFPVLYRPRATKYRLNSRKKDGNSRFHDCRRSTQGGEWIRFVCSYKLFTGFGFMVRCLLSSFYLIHPE